MTEYETELNLGSYEKEKLKLTRSQLSRTVDMIDLIIKMFEYCEEQGIFIRERPNLHDLRYAEGLAGPESDVAKLEERIDKVYSAILREVRERGLRDIKEEFSIRFIENKRKEEKNIIPEQTRGYNG